MSHPFTIELMQTSTLGREMKTGAILDYMGEGDPI